MNNVELLSNRQLRVIYKFFVGGGAIKKDRSTIFSYDKDGFKINDLSKFGNDPIVQFVLYYRNLK